ncbi:hypothetical protein [Streptomyces sp. VB1]|uniref:hypothetical protein n=1 Tax=Streptomyces sp. VB1 TaxID=2986803 RepID=UPI00224270D8|nr:hypothetical protein [Streptomyces sp. VB1]UZI30225.1 hypothetical protein OH133_20025 [Streptomyces sp. VB1]
MSMPTPSSPSQEDAGERPVASAEYAAGALSDVRLAQERAGLRAGLTPAWYGPAAAVCLVGPSVVRAWSDGRGGVATVIALLVSVLGLGVVVALARAARRGAVVLVARSWSSRLRRSRVVLPAVFAAGAIAGLVCWAAGAGQSVTQIGVFGVWGIGVWGACLARNASVRRALRRLA